MTWRIVVIGAIGAALVAGASRAVRKGSGADHSAPTELGRVAWRRDLNEALAAAKDQRRPLLILFQEVPGCGTCVGYGQRVLRHPLIVESAEDLFVPLAIYNNVAGADRAALESFNEPASNNPVVRIVRPDRSDLVPRLDGDYTVHGLAAAMVTALKEIGSAVPPYLQLLADEGSLDRGQTQRATFAMPCFWKGEAALGGLDGVVATTPGFLAGEEVVDVMFDPSRINYSELLEEARAARCTLKVFTRDEQQQAQAKSVVGRDAVRSDAAIRPDDMPKYYLRQTSLKYLPMTPGQAARVNAAFGLHDNYRRFLSPRQLAALKRIELRPKGDWPLAVDTPDFAQAWYRLEAAIDRESPTP